MTSRSFPFPAAALAAGGLALLALAGCDDDGANFDLSKQIGPNPVLPEPSSSLFTGIKVAEVVGWKNGETPSVPEGLAVTPCQRPRQPAHGPPLPNGDVLVVQSRGPEGEPATRPKDVIRGWIMSYAHGFSGGEQKESNLITLLRDTDRDGKVDERSDLLTGLASPFGVAWIDDTLYVAATDAILAYPYKLG